MRKIKRVDYFRKTDSELYKGRSMGACFSLLALIFITYIMVKNIMDFQRPIYDKSISIRNSDISHNYLSINIEIIFKKMPCGLIGQHLWGFTTANNAPSKYTHKQNNKDIEMSRLSSSGRPVPRNYIDESSKWLNYNQEVQQIITGLQTDEQCLITAHFPVDDAPGLFEFSGHGKDYLFSFLKDKYPEEYININYDHQIKSFSYGKSIVHQKVAQKFEGLKELIEFDKAHKLMEVRPVTQNNIRRIYTYYSTVLHHKYKADIDTIHTYQYSLDQKSFLTDSTYFYTEGVVFNYNISPILLTYQKKNKSIAVLIIDALKIIGGVFVTFGICYKILQFIIKKCRKKRYRIR